MLLTLVHYLHVLTGVIWAGGTLTLAWGFFPTLAALGADRAKPVYDRAAPALGALLGSTGGLVMLLGLIRAWAGGGVARFADILAPYGLLTGLALVLMIANGIHGGRFRARFESLLADPGRFAATAPAATRASALVDTLTVLILVAIMVMLGLGRY
jgi:hypothetical protein